jgi:hypothetical protein
LTGSLSAGSIAVRPVVEDVEFIAHVPTLTLRLPNAVLGQVLAKEPPVPSPDLRIFPPNARDLPPTDDRV